MRTGEAAKLLGISKQTLIAWEQKGYIKCYKTLTGQRFYTSKDIRDIQVTMQRAPKASSKRVGDPESQRVLDWDTVRAMDVSP